MSRIPQTRKTIAVHPQPPRRTTHAYGTPKNLLAYDWWGRFGRPIVLLHGLLFDRTMWWPLAAELGDGHTAVAIDLPGHGESAARDDNSLDTLAHDLAMLINRLDRRRAPLLVAHAEAATIAGTFADRYATHAVITVGECRAEPPVSVDQLVDRADLDGVPEHYRQFAVVRRDAGLLDACRCWFVPPAARTPAFAGARSGSAPQAHLGDEPLPHLRDPASFAALLRNVR